VFDCGDEIEEPGEGLEDDVEPGDDISRNLPANGGNLPAGERGDIPDS
jgi:hypothetical protein